MDNKGKLYGIGVGPGDMELLTLKAARILKEVDVICAPHAGAEKESIALSIIQPLLDEREKKAMVVQPLFPMKEDVNHLKKHWMEAAFIISDYLNHGKDVAFITLGDPSIFSTFTYVQKNLDGKYDIEVIPGITSFTACAAAIGEPLVDKDETLTIVPKIDKSIKDIIDKSANFVFMKTSRNSRKVENKILKDPREKTVYSVENCTMEDEKIVEGFSNEKPYLTTTIVKFKN